VRVDIITLFPEMISAVTEHGIAGRAVKNGILEVHTWNPRDFTCDRHRTVDDRPYGGGPGMVMMAAPVTDAIRAAREAAGTDAPVIYLSPQGKKVDHALIKQTASKPAIILLAGRYEGVDERIIQNEVDEEWSIGDYVVSGGELPAMVVVDSLTRQLPGALGDEDSAEQDSFVEGLLDCPHYTRPEAYHDSSVPAVLLSGDHEAIRRWRLKQSLGRTWERRPDLLEQLTLSDEQQQLLEEYKKEKG
jgi:tRNA (guanine37-N1)-methyltransferase